VKVYLYEDDAAPLLPANTILHAIGWYDNSAKNPRNGEPRNWKGFGNPLSKPSSAPNAPIRRIAPFVRKER
jgi:hypothetical protein